MLAAACAVNAKAVALNEVVIPRDNRRRFNLLRFGLLRLGDSKPLIEMSSFFLNSC